MSFPLLLTMIVLVPGDVAVRMKAEPKTVAEFYEAYKRYGLWLPPKDAKLVRWEENAVASGGSGLWHEKRIHLQLQIRKRTSLSPAIVWDNGIEYFEHRKSRLVTVKPTRNHLEGLDWGNAARWLTFSAAAYHLGWTELAEEGFKRGRTSSSYQGFPTERDNDPCYTMTVIRYKTWEECYYQLLEPDTDRLRIYQRMKRVSDDDSLFRSEYHREFLADLDRTICSRQLRRIGSAGLIDQLTEIERDPTRLGVGPSETPSPFDMLSRTGFGAVPEAIRFLEDPRLTRAGVLQGINNGMWIDTARVGTTVRAWLVNLSDGIIDGKDEDNERFGRATEKWFKDAKQVGESKWAMSRAVQNGRVNVVLLQILSAKYPRELIGLYRRIQSEPEYWVHHAVVAALIHADLPRESIVEELEAGASHHSFAIRQAALAGLMIKAPNRMAPLLQRHLAKLAATGDITDFYEHYDYGLIEMLNDHGDASAWQEYATLLHRLTAQRRIEILDRVASKLDFPLSIKCKYKLIILTEAWDDTAIRNRKDNNHILGYAYQYPQIAVGDFVTFRLADYLDIDIPWNRHRSAKDWAAIKETVRAKLAIVAKNTVTNP